MRHANYILSATLFFLAVLTDGDSARAQQFDDLLKDPAFGVAENESSIVVNGVIARQKKYSIIVQAGQQEYEVKLPITVPISRELNRPKFDFAKSTVQITLPCTGAGGDQSKNLVVTLDLPKPTYLVASFNTPENRQAFESGRIKTIGNFSIFKKPQSPASDRKLGGILESTPDGYVLIRESKKYPVELGTKVNLLSGFSILDLSVGTEVTVKADRIDDQWVAQRIQFQKAPQTEIGTSTLPRMLSLGDMVSFSYQRALHEKFAERYSVNHPPANCGGSGNWRLLNRWLGDYTEKKWDVILFNVGMLDANTSQADYQSNLRKWCEAIVPAGNQIIWLNNTPIQKATGNQTAGELVGKVPGRMKLQNQWAAEVLADFPNVKICDLYQVVEQGREADFKDWWAKTRPQFSYRQSKRLVAAIAETIGGE